jgi:Fic family protein
MRKSGEDKKEDIQTVADHGEAVSLMTPMLVGEDSRHRGQLTDLAIELAAKSAGFRRSLPPGVPVALANLVRSMNCYYSNLIEGHDTHPIDIERALKSDYSADPKKRDLQLEARAHIAVQRWIDEGGLRGRTVATDGLLEMHRRFCGLLPDEMLWVEEPETHERFRVEPGALRRRDVRVGRHIPISAGALPRFLEHFETSYRRLGKTDTILASAAAHHRLLWIHPFSTPTAVWRV